MYVMLLLGMMASALVFGWALTDFSPARLVRVIQGAAVTILLLNVVAVWKQETRQRGRDKVDPALDPTFSESWATLKQGGQLVRRLVVVGVGTMAFGMADILLEPFGGQVLGLSVSATTRLTALFALGGLMGFAVASAVAARKVDAHRVAQVGALIGIPAFILVVVAEPAGLISLFLLGNFLIGFGGALFSHGTLTAAMNLAPDDQAGLSLGAWGAVQATAAGVAIAVSSTIRDLVNVSVGSGAGAGEGGVAVGYVAVYALEIVILVVTLVAIVPLIRRRSTRDREAEGAASLTPAEARTS
jgi:BCD family chlorophyll transporter-like MFS transporter